MTDVTPFMKRAYSFFTGQGYSPQAASALAGNAQWESSGSPSIQDPRGEGSIGLYQWRKERRDGLNNFAKARGLSPTDENTQLQYADYELNNTESGPGQALRSAQTVDDANRAMMNYLRPSGWTSNDPTAGHGWANRLALSNAIAGTGDDQPAVATATPTVTPAPQGPVWTEQPPTYAAPSATQDKYKSLLNSGMGLLQAGSAPMGGGPTPQVVRGQSVPLMELVFGKQKKLAA